MYTWLIIGLMAIWVGCLHLWLLVVRSRLDRLDREVSRQSGKWFEYDDKH